MSDFSLKALRIDINLPRREVRSSKCNTTTDCNEAYS